MSILGFANQLYVDSILAQIPVGESTITVDKTFSFGTKPAGVTVIVSDCKYGDTGVLTVEHPVAGTVGQLGIVHLPEGNREVSIFVEDPNTEVPVGLKYRLTLTAVDSNGRNVIVWLLVKR